jgi:hypothetical protein
MTNNTTVTAAALGGALGILVTFVLTQVGVDNIPAEVGGAISTVATALVGLVYSP